jgi:hypothetical protein
MTIHASPIGAQGKQKPKRKWKQISPRIWRRTCREKLPWLRCSHCGTHLTRIDVAAGGRPFARLAGPGRLVEGLIECPVCGRRRKFIQYLNVSG